MGQSVNTSAQVGAPRHPDPLPLCAVTPLLVHGRERRGSGALRSLDIVAFLASADTHRRMRQNDVNALTLRLGPLADAKPSG